MKEMKKEKASFLLRVAPRPNNALNYSGLLWAAETLVFYRGLRHAQTVRKK
jgi:hypothetical protein